MCPIVHFPQCGLLCGLERCFLDHDEHSCWDLDTGSFCAVWQYEVLVGALVHLIIHIYTGRDAGHLHQIYQI